MRIKKKRQSLVADKAEQAQDAVSDVASQIKSAAQDTAQEAKQAAQAVADERGKLSVGLVLILLAAAAALYWKLNSET